MSEQETARRYEQDNEGKRRSTRGRRRLTQLMRTEQPRKKGSEGGS